MDSKIWITGIWGEAILQAVSGLETEEDVEIIRDDFIQYDKLRKVYRFINTRLSGHGISILQKLLETSIFDKYYKLSACNFQENSMNYVVIFNSALVHYYSAGYLERLKKKNNNIKFILYIIDPMPNGVWNRIIQMQNVFDKILTVHPYNTKRYGFQYFPYLYTPPKFRPVQSEPKHLYFCGVIDDHRYQCVKQFIAKCKEQRISYEMHLFKAEKYEKIEDENVYYGLVPYEENIARAINNNCILEIVRENFIGFTQRYYEAIVFNKKLLTNNAEVKQFAYYDERYIQYFEKVEDIDWKWVQEETEVDYKYRGDFDPKKWKENLKRVMENETGHE